jgi:hypothetical protein
MTAFVSGIGITCFAASYAVAWALEVSRLFFRSGVRGAVMIGFAAAGLLAQTLYLAYRAAQAPLSPLSSNFDWCLVAAWMLAVGYFYLMYYHPRAVIGLFMLPLVLALVGGAALFADREPLASEPASQVWGAIHGLFLLFGTVAVMVGFVAGVMYLLQADRLKRKVPPAAGMRFPSLEWLQKVNSRVILVSALMVGVGFVAGIILKLIGDRRGDALPWSDPVVWSSAAMLAWLSTAAVFNAVYKPARQGRKVAYLTVVSFVFLVISLAVLLVVNNEHGGGRGERRADHAVSRLTPSATGGNR